MPLPPKPKGPDVPFDPLSLLSAPPSFAGGDAGPAFSRSGDITNIQSAPFVVGRDAAAAGVTTGSASSVLGNPLLLAAIVGGLGLWIIFARK
ncbi:hypothetical protein [Pelagibius sp.]|uniref:hypothetical protein n=1 Tax=Pelagibius sp. TaxID=1931238 RepID=UPI00260C64FE|nr:hypothetical protein [Pelagibius sp.]